MPEESINTFINNIVALAVFVSVIIVIFLIFLLISRLSILRTRRRLFSEEQNNLVDYEKNFSHGPIETLSVRRMIDFRRDPFILKNILVIATVFIMFIFSIIIVLLAFYVINNLKIGPAIYLILGIFFSMLAGTVYIIKSKTLN